MSWVHHPHEDALIVSTEVANNIVNRLLMDSGSAVNILYGFTGDSVILEEIIKPTVTQGEPPRAVTMVNEFLAMKCPSAFNRVLGPPLLKALKVVTSIHCLTIKFPIVAEIGQFEEDNAIPGSAIVNH